MDKQTPQIKDVLEKLYAKYNHRRFIRPDPLQFVYQYSRGEDMEIAGFLAASLAFGRVGQIEKSVSSLLGRMGESPYEFVKDFGESERKKLRDFRHRFISGDDISDLLELLREVVCEFGGIEKFFAKGYNPNDNNTVHGLAEFSKRLLAEYAKRHGGQAGRGLKYLLAGPAAGGACKKLNLFLRWMVRDDEVDAGLWKSVDKAKLIVPVDVHMSRLCRILGLYERKTVSLAAAIEITESFAAIEPADPVKYDFALSRIGIIEQCSGRYRPACKECELLEFCLRREN